MKRESEILIAEKELTCWGEGSMTTEASSDMKIPQVYN